MGQFASKAFDGDPYIDIMRALPERELVWWVQKVIWVAEGYTFFEHFKRTYPATLLHKCQHCNGAGTVTCPECHGYKQRRVLSPVFKLSERTASGRLADSHLDECKSCGSYCPWDAEEAWHAKWGAWESKLSYYDRTYGPLFDEWYDDVLNEGNLELDSPEPEDPIPSAQRQPGPDWDVVRDIAKSSRRMEALMRRFGGHPYENEDMIPYEAVDPTLSIGENVYALMENYNYLPLELNPEANPELLLEPNGPFARFHEEIDMEFSIMSNLDAAIKDTMKPYNFGPSAGTVPCPVCHNEPYFWSITPNGDKILDLEEPFWVRTLRLMGANHWLMQPDGTPPPPFLDDRRQAQATLRPPHRRHGEYPSVTAEEVDAAEVPSTLELVTGRAVTQTQRYRPYLEKLVFGKPSGREPVYMYDFGMNVVEEPSEWVEEPALQTRLEGLKERVASGKLPGGEAVRQATREVAGLKQRELNSHPIYGQRRRQSAKAGGASWYREKHRHDDNKDTEELLRGSAA